MAIDEGRKVFEVRTIVGREDSGLVRVETRGAELERRYRVESDSCASEEIKKKV